MASAATPNLPLFEGPLPQVLQMGRSIFDPIWAQQQHVDQSSELLHVLRGSVRIETPTYSITGREGDTLYTPAGVPHRDVFPPGSVFEVYLVQFRWAGERALLQQFTPEQLAGNRGGSSAVLGPRFDELFAEYQCEGDWQPPLLGLHLAEILCRLARDAQQQPSAAQDESAQQRQRRLEIMVHAKQAIARLCHQPVSLEDIAAEVDVSPSYLSRVFSSESGFTLSTYLTRLRMEKAAHLLAQTNEPIKAVAAHTGFRDSHYFTKVFRSHYHLTPSAYRARQRRG